LKDLQSSDLANFQKLVQHNCDIADARHAGEDTLCIYLLKLKGYFSWYHAEPIGAPTEKEVLGRWVSERENYWMEIEDQSYRPLELAQQQFDPYDTRAINALLRPRGLVYSAGTGTLGKPIFFLGELEETEEQMDYTLMVSGREHARTLTAPPAMSRSGEIYVRKDAFRRYLFSMYEEWQWQKQQNAMARVVGHYRFDKDIQDALDRMVEHETENLVLHELGEIIAGNLIGDGWSDMLSRLEHPLHELKARAIRDNLADCLSTLPACLEFDDEPALDFYYSNMSPLRKQLFPAICEILGSPGKVRRKKELSKLLVRGQQHWLRCSRTLLGSDGPELGAILDGCAL